MPFFKLFLIALLAFIPLDLLWLGVVAKGVYNRYVGQLMSEQPDWLAAILFYLIFLSGIVFFVVKPSLEDPVSEVLLRGAFFGLVTYGTYDLVNRAVLANYPWPLVIIDILWGVFLCATVSWVSWYFGR